MRPTTDLTTKLIFGLSAIMTVMIGVVIYTVIFGYEDPWSPPAEAAPVEAGLQACDASDPTSVACPPGYYCRFDTCQPVELTPMCGQGDSCKDCECAEGLACHHYRCMDPATVDRTPLECKNDKKLAAAVRTLAEKCSRRSKDVDEIISAGSCSQADWEQLALNDDKFDLLLAAFPNRFAVLFPPGRPHLNKKSWPSVAIHEHLVEQVRQFREPLTDAKQVFVIGRSSPDGTAKTNHLLTLARIKLVSNLIDQVVRERLTETKSSMRSPRIRTFALSSRKPINPARFKSTYLGAAKLGDPLELERLVLESEASRASIAAALEGGVDLNDTKARGYAALFNALNRVVLVIPIPCTGDEYEPPASILDDN